MKLWRIAAETRSHAATDLSGRGAASFPGRWNETGLPVIYSASTLALAVLETAAHVDDAGLPLNRFVLQIDVPDKVWQQRQSLDVTTLPLTWSAIPAGSASIKMGSDWLKSQTSAILLVPSVIVPEEFVTLINPLHPAAGKIKATVTRAFDYKRLFRG